MDLLATVRKEGSRGGQGDFSWSDVQNSSRREHYLGHSLMAPVGRWSKGRDLNWYAKGDAKDADGEDAAEKAARERKEEIKRVKEAEEDALARALGLPVPVRDNANMEPVSDKREVDKVLKDVTGTADEAGRGIGFGTKHAGGVMSERIEGNAENQDKELQYALKEYRRRHSDQKQSDRDGDRERRHRSDREHHRSHRDRSRDRSRERRRERPREHHHRRRSRSGSPDRRHDRRSRHRSRSPR